MSRVRRVILLLLVVAVGGWAFLFSLANSDSVALDLVFLQLAPAAVSVWVIGAFVAGGLSASRRAAWRSGARAARSRRGGGRSRPPWVPPGKRCRPASRGPPARRSPRTRGRLRTVIRVPVARQLIQVGIHDANDITRPLVMPPGTPKELAQIMRKAVTSTHSDPAFLEDARKANLTIDPVPGEEIEKRVAALFSLSPSLKSRHKEILFGK